MAHFDKRDFSVYVTKPLSALDMTLIETTFEQDADEDCKEITKSIKDSAILRKVCIVKLLLALPQWVITRVVLGKLYAEDHMLVCKLYWNFFFKKINYNDFKKEYTKDNK